MLDDGTREEKEGGLEDAGDEGIISFLLIFFPSRSRLNERVARVPKLRTRLADDANPGTSFQLPTSKQASEQTFAQTWGPGGGGSDYLPWDPWGPERCIILLFA
jgi:hypothetical protein